MQLSEKGHRKPEEFHKKHRWIVDSDSLKRANLFSFSFSIICFLWNLLVLLWSLSVTQLQETLFFHACWEGLQYRQSSHPVLDAAGWIEISCVNPVTSGSHCQPLLLSGTLIGTFTTGNDGWCFNLGSDSWVALGCAKPCVCSVGRIQNPSLHPCRVVGRYLFCDLMPSC